MTLEMNYIHCALQDVLQDPSFNTKSSVAAAARQDALTLLHWCQQEENSEEVNQFMKQVMADMSQCLAAFKRKKGGRDRLWKKYFALRTSEKFTNQWKTFLSTAQCLCTPMLYQHLVDLFFKRMLNEEFDVTPEEQTVELRELTETEANIIRYVAGYICRHLQRKLEHENHPLKKDLILNLTSMVKFNLDDASGPCEDWLDLMDRGGLWHVRETVYSFFVSLEQEVQVQLKSPSFVKGTGEQKEKICRNIYESDDIQFYWLIVSADFEIEDTQVCEILYRKLLNFLLL